MSTRISSTSLRVCACVVCVCVYVCAYGLPLLSSRLFYYSQSYHFCLLYFILLYLSLFSPLLSLISIHSYLYFYSFISCLVYFQDLLKILTKLMTTCLLFADQMKRFISNSRVRQQLLTLPLLLLFFLFLFFHSLLISFSSYFVLFTSPSSILSCVHVSLSYITIQDVNDKAAAEAVLSATLMTVQTRRMAGTRGSFQFSSLTDCH